MKDFYHITVKSGNRKTGKLTTIMSSNETCPDSCPLKKKGCYARGWPLNLHWKNVSDGKNCLTFTELLDKLRGKVSKRVRLWQAGDMPGVNNRINIKKIRRLVKACSGKEAFGYTHKDPKIGNNAEAIKYCNDNGVTINLSADNLKHADELYDLKIAPVVVLLPKDIKGKIKTPKGRKVIICPADKNKITCSVCGSNKGSLCYRNDRNYIIGFRAHGAATKSVSEIARGV